ncbi:hypothetical protein BJX68DRAFT_40727 [Aspergillus pseudodeflectus]|uniref:Uncharacterized protein n=1 Tax=Aspergillus pseudodeflectus TaxID=176178 RepID=A0ABR4KSK8_9EURO
MWYPPAVAHYPNPLIEPPSYGEIVYASGSSSEGTVRSRRSNRSTSSDEATPPAPAESDQFTEEDFRAGGPNLCEPPVENSNVFHVAQYKALTTPPAQHMRSIDRVATDARVRVREIRYCARRSAFARPRPDPRFTVLIYADRHDPTERGWVDAARRVLQYLTESGILGAAVEIIDPRFDRKPSVFPCYPTDPICSRWARVSRDIINCIDLRGVHCVGCYRVGMSSNRRECPVTILVGVVARAREDWGNLRETIIRVLDGYDLGSVSVLVRWDTLWLDGRDSLSQSALAGTDNGATEEGIADITPGTSLQLHQKAMYGAAASTFGGWFELRWNGGEWKAFGITCTHGVIPDATSPIRSEPLDVERWTRDGIRLGIDRAPKILTVEAPTRAFIEARIASLEEYIEQQTGSDTYKRIALFVEEEVELEDRDQKTWDTMNHRIALYRSIKATYTSMLEREDYVFGRVMAASDLRVLRGTSGWNDDRAAYLKDQASNLDWALVKPRDGVTGSNKISAPAKYSILPEEFSLIDFNFNALKHNDTLFKVGAQSGPTRGWYGGLFECRVSRSLAGGSEEVVVTMEHTIVAGQNQCVVAPGDSGSLVTTGGGEVVGLLFGGSDAQHRGYFTPAKALVRDIKEYTGATEVRVM